MSQEITLSKVKSFVEGNYNFYKERIFGQPIHLKEQYLYRIYKCSNDCIINKECKHCKCPVNKKMWAPESNGCEYPDFMSGTKWEEFKKENNIDLKDLIKNIEKNELY